MGRDLTFSNNLYGAWVRVFEQSSSEGGILRCEIRYPRGRYGKRYQRTLGLARLLNKTMIVETLLPPLVKEIQERHGKRKAPSLSAAITDFLKRHGEAKKPATYEHYKYALKVFKEFVGDQPLDQIDSAKLAVMRDTFSKTPQKANAVLQAVHCLFEKAIEWGSVKENPAKRVKRLTRSQPKIRMLTNDQWKALLLAARADHCEWILDWILWEANTAMRPCEVEAIRESELDLKKGWLLVPTSKTNTPRWVKLNATAIAIALRRWHGDGGLLFRNRQGKPLTKQSRDYHWKRTLTRAGIYIRPYDLRCDLIARGALGGYSLPQLRDLAGHKSLAMVNHYTQLARGHLEPMMKALEVTAEGVKGDEPVTSPGGAWESVQPEVVDLGGEETPEALILTSSTKSTELFPSCRRGDPLGRPHRGRGVASPLHQKGRPLGATRLESRQYKSQGLTKQTGGEGRGGSVRSASNLHRYISPIVF